jgi:hypothetical protein
MGDSWAAGQAGGRLKAKFGSSRLIRNLPASEEVPLSTLSSHEVAAE